MSCSSDVRRLSIETINVYKSASVGSCFGLDCSALFRFRLVTFSMSKCLVYYKTVYSPAIFFFLLAVDCYFFENENIIIHMKYLSESNLCPTSLLA